MLEVTETLLVKDAVRGAATLQQLRDLGVQLALDDFGTGYSSLSYLRNLPLDTLKIAREFVEGLAFSEHDAAFVRLIVGLAKTVGLKVVAEGIETRAQLDMLRRSAATSARATTSPPRWTPTRTGSRRPPPPRRPSWPPNEVRAKGLEPPRLAAPAPKAGVSANSTTPAAAIT